MENNLFLIGITESLEKISNHITLSKMYEVPHYNTLIERERIPNWNNIKNFFYIINYNQDKRYYRVIPLGVDVHYYMEKEENLFSYMDAKHIQFIGDNNPLGKIFQSFPMVFLELSRWTADVAWTKEKYNQLIGE